MSMTNNGLGINQFIHTGKNGENPEYVKNPKIIAYENGPVFKSITTKSEAAGCSSLSQEIILFNDLDKIEIVNSIDKNKEYGKESIRFAFPLSIINPISRINLAWAVIEPEKDQLSGANKELFYGTAVG